MQDIVNLPFFTVKGVLSAFFDFDKYLKCDKYHLLVGLVILKCCPSNYKKYKANNIYSKLGTALAVSYYQLYENLEKTCFEKYRENIVLI